MIRHLYHAFQNRKRKQRSRLYRYTNRTLTFLGIVYGLLMFFPDPLFAHTARVGQFTFHSDRLIPAQIESVAERAIAKLSASPLYAPTDTFDVYIASDPWRRTLLIPRARGAYGASVILTGKTMLNRCDIETDTSFNDQPDFNHRPMHAVLAHECMHHLIASHLGLIDFLRLPRWKNEGYCEYVAGSPSFDVSYGEKLLRNGERDESPAFRYLTYLFAVRSCIDEHGMEPIQFLSEPLDFEMSLDAFRKQIQAENTDVNAGHGADRAP